jgi:hypothetical protein
MNKFIYLILVVFLSTSIQLLQSSPVVEIDSLHYEVIMSSKMLDESHINDKFIDAIDITSDCLFLLSANNRFNLLGWGGIKTIGKEVAKPINSFAYTPEGFLMIISNDELCYFDSLGNLTKLFNLPNAGMKICAGKSVMYIYDCNTTQTTHALYVLASSGKYIKLFDSPAPIQSVLEMNNSLLFSTKNVVFNFNPQNKELKIITALAGNKTIKSLAVDTTNNRLYFSTDSLVCTIKDTDKVLISDKLGGIVRFYNGGLVVFNPVEKYLVRIVGLERKIAFQNQCLQIISSIKQANKTLSNSTIIDLANKKISDDLIINLINGSRVNFELCVDCMINLAGQNVSSPVIKAMKIAMRKQSTATK